MAFVYLQQYLSMRCQRRLTGRANHRHSPHRNHRYALRCSIGRINQRVLAQVSVALSGLDLGVTENLLHLVQATAGVHQKAGKAVAQVMDADIGQSGLLASGIP